MQRTTLATAAAIATFVVVLMGGLATYLSAQTKASAVATPTAAPSATMPAPQQGGLDPTAVALAIEARDHAYQQHIQQANEQLQQANQQLSQAYQKQQELAAQLNSAYQQQRMLAGKLKQANQRQQAVMLAQPRQAAPPTPPPQPTPTSPPQAPAYAVSADTAAAIALGAVPGAQLASTPTLVSFQGAAAYEVVLDRGTLYVDANSGQILYNGTVSMASGGHGGEHEGGEHEGDD